MAKVTQEDKQEYYEKTTVYRETIDGLLQREKTVLDQIQQGAEDAAEKRVALAEDMLNLVSCYIILNGVSESMLRVKDEEALNEGRKALYRCVCYLEEIVGTAVDAAFEEYEDRLKALHFLDPIQRYRLARKIGFTIQLLENAFGQNTKWRWSFVDLEGRYAAAAKNIFDLKSAVENRDPRSPWYEPTVYHLRLIIKLFKTAAQRYQEKFALSSKSADDIRMGINFLSGLKRIHFLIGERNQAEALKKPLEVWQNLFESARKQQSKTAQG